MNKLKRIKGTHDLLQQEKEKHLYVVNTVRKIAKKFGFDSIDTPIFEFTDVFSRPLGETSDVVTKEMYTFETRGGDCVTLRPEGTAGIVRAFIENGLTQSGPFKVFYEGAMFRYERPQKGRQRQFHQFGVEALSLPKPATDVEIISMGQMIIEELGIAKDIKLHINSLGDQESRDTYRKKLISYLSDFKNDLSEDSKNRLEKNPLRILDSKDKKDREILKNAPIYYDSLNDVSKQHFDDVLNGLEKLNIKFTLDNNMVRGFDYYCHTAFEFITNSLGAQGTVLGGGRYDNLCEIMGGNPTSGIGFAGGIERLALMIDNISEKNNKIVVIGIDGETQKIGLKIANELRYKTDFVIETFFGNLKKGLKYSDKINANTAIILGEDELSKKTAIIRDLKSGEQQEIKFDEICNYIKKGNK